jgi:hypothetical protein
MLTRKQINRIGHKSLNYLKIFASKKGSGFIC